MRPQQSAPEVHIPLAAVQAHLPPVHAAPLQQSAPVVHAPPLGLQHRPVVGLDGVPVQLSEPQHVVPPDMHAPPAEMHIAPILWQRPPWQVSGAMQSLLPVQGPPVICWVQRPLRQLIEPQHWLSVLHEPPLAPQQRLEPCDSAHDVPEAQEGIPPGVQGDPAGREVVPSMH